MNHHRSSLSNFSAAIERLEPRRLLSDVYEPNNSLGTATNFGTLGDREEFGLDISPSGDQDFFKFTAAGTGNAFIRISFISFFGDLDLYLYGPSNTVVESSIGNSNTEEINYTVSEGQTYTINVAGFAAQMNMYDMLIDAPDSGSGITADRFEPNDSFAAATNLGTLGDRTENDLSVHQANNADFFKFVPYSTASVIMSIAFTHSAGDLDMILYASDQVQIDASEGQVNTETITRALTAGQTYYLRVFGFDGATNPDYDLSIDGPAIPAPTVASSSFQFQTRHDIQFNFDQDVAASLTVDDLSVKNLSTNQTLPSSDFTLEITSPAGAPTVALWKANSTLPDANYRATLNGAGVTNGSGTPVSGSPTRDFFVLAGDADHDRDVDVNDLGLLATNWQQSPRTFGQGDYDYTGTVDVNDLGILATKWQQTLAAPAVPFATDVPRSIKRVATEVL